jgi:hypothetical protein
MIIIIIIIIAMLKKAAVVVRFIETKQVVGYDHCRSGCPPQLYPSVTLFLIKDCIQEGEI